MNKNDQQFMAQKIRAQYMEKEPGELDELRELDEAVKRPASIFAYVLGSIAAIIMGAGMSLVMTDIGSQIGIENNMFLGIFIGIIGLVLALVNYPIYKRNLENRKKEYGPKIIALSEKIINNSGK